MSDAKVATPRQSSGFGFNPRPRRRVPSAPANQKSNEELVAEFLKKNKVTRCPSRYAEGAIKTSGYYEF